LEPVVAPRASQGPLTGVGPFMDISYEGDDDNEGWTLVTR